MSFVMQMTPLGSSLFHTCLKSVLCALPLLVLSGVGGVEMAQDCEGWHLPSTHSFFCVWAVLCLYCCAGFSRVAVSVGYSLVVVCVLLVVMASIVEEHGL